MLVLAAQQGNLNIGNRRGYSLLRFSEPVSRRLRLQTFIHTQRALGGGSERRHSPWDVPAKAVTSWLHADLIRKANLGRQFIHATRDGTTKDLT